MRKKRKAIVWLALLSSRDRGEVMEILRLCLVIQRGNKEDGEEFSGCAIFKIFFSFDLL